MGTFQESIMIDLQLSSFQFSWLSSTIFLIIYGTMQIPAGLLIDHFGLKKTLFIGTVICAIASMTIAATSSFPIAIAARVFMGFGASFGFIALLVSVNEWMPHQYRALFIGLSQFLGTIGPMLAAGPMDTLSETYGIDWRTILFILFFIGIVLSILILCCVQNNAELSGKLTILYKPERPIASLKRLCSRSQPLILAFLSASLYFNIEYLAENEGRLFLSLKGISKSNAGFMITISWLGFAISCPLMGALSDYIEKRKPILIFASLCSIFSILLIIYGFNQYTLFFAFFLLGVSASGQSITFASIGEQFKPQFLAIGYGLNNGMMLFIGAINAPAIGFFLDRLKGEGSTEYVHYLSVFQILIATSVLGSILAVFFVQETYGKSAVDFTYLNPHNHLNTTGDN